MAVGGEGTHAEFLGEFERAPIVVFRFGRIRWIAACVDVTEQVQKSLQPDYSGRALIRYSALSIVLGVPVPKFLVKIGLMAPAR